MGVKSFKPTSPGIRHRVIDDFADITKTEPEKGLTIGKKRTGGRNNKGRTTARFRGGGAKRLYRFVDFKRKKLGVPAKVAAIEYDPNRSARIALLHYADGEKRYIIAPLNLKVGDTVMSGPEAEIKIGNALPLEKIPTGTMVYNIEMRPGKGGQIARSAGTMAQIMAKEGKFAILRLPSGEIRKIDIRCYATIGQVGNPDHSNIVLGKAGASRWRGFRPHNRGTSMNPIDHPHGGGEGRSKGYKAPVSPWDVKCKGFKTRKKGKSSDKYIIKRRKSK